MLRERGGERESRELMGKNEIIKRGGLDRNSAM